MITRGASNVVAIGNRDCHSPGVRDGGAGFTLLIDDGFARPFRRPLRCNGHVTSFSGVLKNNILIRHFNSLIGNEHAGRGHVLGDFAGPALGTAPNSLDLILPGHRLSSVVRVVCTLSGVTPNVTGTSALLCNMRMGFCDTHLRLSDGLRAGITGVFTMNSNTNVAHKLSRTDTDNI